MKYTSLDKGDHELLLCDRCCVEERFTENQLVAPVGIEGRRRFV